MSYPVLHLQKVKGSELKEVQAHNQREKEEIPGDGIDRRRTILNVDLVNEQPFDYKKVINKTIDHRYTGQKTISKDAIKLCNVTVINDASFFDSLSPEEEKRFFDTSLLFFQERYDQKNIMYAVVHKDESAPHIHIGFIPFTEDDQLSAKDFFGQNKDLYMLQSDFHTFLKQHNFDLDRPDPKIEDLHLEVYERDLLILREEVNRMEQRLNEGGAFLGEFEKLTGGVKEKSSIQLSEGFKTKSVMEIPKEDYKELYTLALQSYTRRRDAASYKQKYEQTLAELNDVRSRLREVKQTKDQALAYGRVLTGESELLRDTLQHFKQMFSDSYEHLDWAIGHAKASAHLSGKTKEVPIDFYDRDNPEELEGARDFFEQGKQSLTRQEKLHFQRLFPEEVALDDQDYPES